MRDRGPPYIRERTQAARAPLVKWRAAARRPSISNGQTSGASRLPASRQKFGAVGTYYYGGYAEAIGGINANSPFTLRLRLCRCSCLSSSADCTMLLGLRALCVQRSLHGSSRNGIRMACRIRRNARGHTAFIRSHQLAWTAIRCSTRGSTATVEIIASTAASVFGPAHLAC